MSTKQSRRVFVELLAKATGAAVGSNIIASHSAFARIASHDMSVLPNNCDYLGEKKVLVAYESQFGSTAEVADFVAKNLNTKLAIDIVKITDVTDLSAYSTVIVGSAIQYDTWMKEARQFIDLNQDALSTKSVSYFLVCLTLSKKSQAAKKQAQEYADKIVRLSPKVKVKQFGQFAGVLDYSKMSFSTRIFAKGIMAILGVKEGDYRDWDQIRLWAEGLFA